MIRGLISAPWRALKIAGAVVGLLLNSTATGQVSTELTLPSSMDAMNSLGSYDSRPRSMAWDLPSISATPAQPSSVDPLFSTGGTPDSIAPSAPLVATPPEAAYFGLDAMPERRQTDEALAASKPVPLWKRIWQDERNYYSQQPK